MSVRQATRSLSGEIRSGQGTFGSSMRIVLFEAGLGGEGNLGSQMKGAYEDRVLSFCS